MESQVFLRGYLYCYTFYNWSLNIQMQYEALLYSATLNVSLFFNLATAAISSTAAAVEMYLPWCRWHLAKTSMTKRQLTNKTWPRHTWSIKGKKLSIVFLCGFVFFTALRSAPRTATHCDSSWQQQTRSRWTDIQQQERENYSGGIESCLAGCQPKHLRKSSWTMSCCYHSVVGLLNTITRAAKSTVVNVARNYSEKMRKVYDRD